MEVCEVWAAAELAVGGPGRSLRIGVPRQLPSVRPLPTDGGVSGPAAIAHDHLLPVFFTLREVPGGWEQLWADRHLQVPLPLLANTHWLWYVAFLGLMPPASDSDTLSPLPAACLLL